MTQILLLACYELGHQPLSLAWPTAVLRQAGFRVTAVDLSVSPLPRETAVSVPLIAIAVPMHTALRLGVQAAQQVRALNPRAHICFYGLYAWLNRDYLLDGLADSVLAGEMEGELVTLTQQVLNSAAPSVPAQPALVRLSLPVPERSGLPDLSHYARYEADGVMALSGYVETTRGCLHTCRHCPVVPVYHGRFFVIPAATVLADVRQQVAAGARHITFGDPDFLNGPGHALAITRALHAEFPRLTFDFTTKVEHILQHRALIPELRALGASFVVSAFESTSDAVLDRLQKGHTVADMAQALTILADAGLPVQPTWVPFTPWTSLDDYLAMLAWIRAYNLIANVPVVQLSIRLLVPPESALLDHPDVADWCGPLDAVNFTYRWRHPDPCMDELQKRVAALAEAAGDDPQANFTAVEQIAYGINGRVPPAISPVSIPQPVPPRLTEDWFC
ncbi:MAG: radical SAM protein [Ardenticatenaceae bacterium]|nr:radical SAM protein [Ardenticatenaceae bacterium]MCB8988432.1 radical SAM protein [Ardenticatenaceae bacterium]